MNALEQGGGEAWSSPLQRIVHLKLKPALGWWGGGAMGRMAGIHSRGLDAGDAGEAGPPGAKRESTMQCLGALNQKDKVR